MLIKKFIGRMWLNQQLAIRVFLHLNLAVGFKYAITMDQADRGVTTSVGASGVTQDKHLQVRSGSPFKIAVFADLHFGENAWSHWGPKQDVNSIRVMSLVLDKEKPV